MEIVIKAQKYSIEDDNPYAKAIIAIVGVYNNNNFQKENNSYEEDYKKLWQELNEKHKKMLTVIAESREGIYQFELEKKLKVNWQGLRGIHNGFARICERLNIRKPIIITGYNSNNRKYSIEEDKYNLIKSLINCEEK